MYPGGLIEGQVEYYDCEYVKRNSIDANKGAGALFRYENGSSKAYLAGEEMMLEPSYVYPDEVLFYQSAIDILKWQNYLNSLQPDLSLLSNAQRKDILKLFRILTKQNDFFIEQQKKKLAAFEKTLIKKHY